MRSILLVLLSLVAAVLLWVIWSEAYIDSLVFTLGLVAAALSSYLVSDYFFINDKKTWQSDIDLYKKEISILKEELDISQKQLSMTIPQAEIDDLRKRLHLSDEEKNRLNSEFLAQVGNIASLNTRLEALQKEYNKYQEESYVTSESRLTELEALRDTLSTFKSKLSELIQNNKTLKEELAQLKNEMDFNPTEIDGLATKNMENTEGVDAPIVFLNNDNAPSDISSHRTQSKSIDDQDMQQDDLADTVDENIVQSVEYQTIMANKNDHGTPEDTEPEPTPSSSSYFIDNIPEDLKAVEGIGPKIEILLKESGIKGLKDLSSVPVENLREILAKGGARYKFNDPTSWPEQARSLMNGEHDKRRTYNKEVYDGKDKSME